MYGAKYYLAYVGYGAMRLFQDEILRDHVDFWFPGKIFTGPVLL